MIIHCDTHRINSFFSSFNSAAMVIMMSMIMEQFHIWWDSFWICSTLNILAALMDGLYNWWCNTSVLVYFTKISVFSGMLNVGVAYTWSYYTLPNLLHFFVFNCFLLPFTFIKHIYKFSCQQNIKINILTMYLNWIKYKRMARVLGKKQFRVAMTHDFFKTEGMCVKWEEAQMKISLVWSAW